MKTTWRKQLACALCSALLLSGCAEKSTRTILIEAPKSGGAQAEQSGAAGDIKEIHSIKQKATLDEKNIGLEGLGWMDDTRLCAVARYETQGGSAFLVSVDDTYGFVKKLEGTEGEGWYMLSPDGKSVAYATKDLVDYDKQAYMAADAGKFIPPQGYQSICLYQTQSAEVTRVYQNQKGFSLSEDTFCFSPNGRYVSFMEYNWDGSEKVVHIYDLQSDALKTYTLFVDDVMINPRWIGLDDQGQPSYVLGYSKGKGTSCVRLITDETYRQVYPEQMLIGDIYYELYANLGDRMLFLNQYNELVCKHLTSGKSQILQRSVLGMVASENGKRVAYIKASGNNSELYVADLMDNAQDNAAGLSIQNARVVYTGSSLSLIQWNPSGDKLLILDQDKEESRSSYRVLEFYTSE